MNLSGNGPLPGPHPQPHLKRRTVLATAAAVGPVALALRYADTAAANDTVGAWSAPFDMRGVAIHATLMHTDEVLFFQDVEGPAGVDRTSYVATWNWRTGELREAPIAGPRDLFCSAHHVLPDGRVFCAGGHDPNTGKKQDPIGVVENDIYDPVTRTWTRVAPLTQKRWYPTAVGLPNGRVLVFGGTASPGVASRTVDEFNSVTGTLRRLPSTADKGVGQYPRMYLMANGKVLLAGPQATTAAFDPATNRWANVARTIYGKRSHGAVALLPGAQRVLSAGGGSPTRTAETLDTASASPRWRSTGSLIQGRVLGQTVVLPDGKVLLVGGGGAFKYTAPTKVPELYDPATGTWTSMAPQQGGRMYHATTLLLPDGRVLSCGQDSGSLAKYGEIFSPPYLFRGARPTVSDSPATVAAGGVLQFTSPEAASLSRVVLVRPASMTHEVDSDQRSVPLSFSASGSQVTAQLPGNVNLLPPGYYMLFVLNGRSVPALAPWVRVTL